MTAFDIVTLLILGVSALLAYARGFVREVFSIAALAAGGFAALYGYPAAKPIVDGFIDTDWLSAVATGVGLFVAAYVVVTVVTIQLHAVVHRSQTVGLMDRTAGGLFGLARGLIIVALGVMVLRAATPPDKLPGWLADARLYPIAAMTADALAALAPQGSALARQGADAAPETDAPADSASQTPAERDKGYTERDRDQMDQLMNAASGQR